MCGVAALFSNVARADSRQTLQSMLAVIRHRGPDGEGIVVGQDQTVTETGRLANWGLAHVRLAILDLSSAGLQPMATTDQRVWITYNGEVYNYLELAEELRELGHVFRTGTDTEVILAAYRRWGTDCVTRFRGMFALVLVDLDRAIGFAVRDRLGIKPLHFWADRDQVFVVSEIKQLSVLPTYVPRLNQQQAMDYLCEGVMGHEPDQTMLQGVRPLSPGHTLTWKLGQLPVLEHQQSYWSPSCVSVPVEWNDAVQQTRDVFQRAVQLRLRSDVPVGTCLSGGIDSSSIVGVAARDFGARMKTFSVCHNDPAISEEHYIDDVVRHCQAESFKLRFSEDQALADFDRFVYHQDEPVFSFSQFAEYLVMRLARQNNVTVMLNGQGGDEALCGYRKYVYFYLRQLLSAGRYPAAVAHIWNTLRRGDRQIFQFWQGKRYVPSWLRGSHDPWRHWLRPDLLRLRRAAWKSRMQKVRRLHEHQWADLRFWSLPVLLRYQDRNSMAHGIEARVPLVDHQFIELTLTLPEEYFFHRGMTKRLLIEGMADRLPESLHRRRTKLGFDTPQAGWLRGPVGEALERRVRSCVPMEPLLDRAACGDAFRDYRQGDARVPHFVLFRLACLAVWLERFSVQPV